MGPQNKQKLNQSKERAETTKTPDAKRAKALAEAAKKKGLRKIPVAKAKMALKALKAKLSTAPKKAIELAFTAKELKQIEKALGLSLSKLDKKTLAYRIKMIDVDSLDKAEGLLAGTGARIFTMIEKEGKKEAVPLGYKFKKDDKISVHFRKNEVAEDNYGMRHLFKKQPEIRQVKIKQTSKRGKGREGIATRRSLDGNFYFADGSYAPIFTGTEIEVIKVFTPIELTNYKKTSTAYNVGKGRKRYMSSQGAKQITGYYGITPPSSSNDVKKNKEYWNKVDGTDYVRNPRARSMVTSKEYIPRNEREKHFFKKYQEIMAINDKQKLIDMVNTIPLLHDDPIVQVPNERRGKRLRTGAALRYALFKRHAELCGHKVYVTSAYRSAKTQAKIWYRGLARRTRKFSQKYPNKSPREIQRLARAENARFIAPPGKSHHNTGGAIDISISGLTMYKYKASRSKYNDAVGKGILAGLHGKNKKAMQTLIYMERTLKASHFMGRNYFRETWHWNVDPKINGRYVYRNV